MFKDSASGYGLVTIILHWISAPLILFTFGLGIYMRGLDYYSPWYHRGPELHIALGLLILLLMSLRLIWRVGSTSPDAISTIARNQLIAANLVKVLLYACVFVICITGYFITTAEGTGANFFGVFSVPATVQLSPALIDRAGFVHKYVAWAIVAIALVHASAAIFHHFVKRDKTLVRMLKPADKAD